MYGKSRLLKIAIVSLFLLSIGWLASNFSFLMKKEKELIRFSQIQKQLEKLEEERIALTLQVAELNKQKQRPDKKLVHEFKPSQEKDSLAYQLFRKNQQLESLREKYQELEQDYKKLVKE